MGTPQTPRRPVFFWQAVFILLPVVVLSMVSLVSLQQDEKAAEQDARNRAAEGAQSLARTMHSSVNGELQRFLTLQNVWMMGLFTASQPTVEGVFPDAKLKGDIASWEQDYPGMTLSEEAATGEILADGRQITPPDYSPVPEPPKWYLELSPDQKSGWEALRWAEMAGADPAKIAARQQAFFATHPSQEAELAANYVTRPPEQLLGGGATLATESGISFQDVDCLRLMLATNVELSTQLLNEVWGQAFRNPSFLTPRLIGLAEGLTNEANGNLSEKVYWMQQLWNSQTRAAGWLETLRELPDLKPWKTPGWSHWTENGEALAIFEGTTFVNHGADAEGMALSGQGYRVWFVPRPVVEAIFQRALAENRFLVPEYVRPVITVEGVSVISTNPPPGGDPNNELGNVEQTAGDAATPNAVNFDIKYFLTSREAMLSAERRRAKMFAGLILGAAFAALAGLLAAWSSFRRQRELNELKSNFVSSVSHELRAPIASVRLMAENLEHGKVPELGRQQEYFRFIVQECRRLSSLIENVLDFSRIEQGRKQYELEPTDLGALTQTTVKLMEPYAAEKGVKLELANPGGAMELNVDGRAIQQALVNLIDNAIKHSAKGEMVTVEIKNEKLKMKNGGEAESSVVKLSVADHGPGIPVAEREKIFERFYRLGSELRRETQGVGIGLSVVKHIVEAHGGRVTVESEPGRGSRLTIELPVKS